MAKFVIRCPECEKDNKLVYMTVSTGLFSKKTVDCPNGHSINVKTDRMAVRECVHCGNNVVYDQSKGDSAKCPVCNTKINTLECNEALVQIKCTQCGCEHSVAKNAGEIDCPVCDYKIDVQKEIGKKKLKDKNIVSLIKYEGDNSTFIWKHPIEDFMYGSQLIVHESQEALFLMGGEILDVFGGGTYSLTTENLPLLSKVYDVASGEGTFHCEVYFVNKVVHTGIKWGTSSRIKFKDPYSGIYFDIGVSGQFNMCISDSKRILLKLIGTTNVFSHNHNLDEGNNSSKPILDFIKATVVTKVRTHFITVMKRNQWSILDIDEYLEELSKGIKDLVNQELEEYGFTLPEFFILNVSTPEESENDSRRQGYSQLEGTFRDNFLKVREEEIKANVAMAERERRLIEAETLAREKMINSQVEAESMRLKGMAEADVQRAQGYTGRDKLYYDVQKTFAENIGSEGGSDIGALMGLGAGFGMMSNAYMDVRNMHSVGNYGGMNQGYTQNFEQNGSMANANINPAQNPQSVSSSEAWICKCGFENKIGIFCPQCGNKKEETGWMCECGAKNMVGIFCPHCGRQKA